MLHGFRSSHFGLIKLAAKLPGFHLIIPDFPGYGQTEELPGPHTVATYTDFIAQFINELGLGDITLMGHSFGAIVGLAYAAANPERVKNLILISPVPEPNLLSQAGSIFYHIGGRLPSPLDKQWFTSRIIQRPMRNLIVRTNDPIIYAEVMSEGERELNDLKPKINVQNFLSLISINPEEWLIKIQAPILVIAGDSDPLTSLSGIIHTYQRPGVTLKVIKGMGHFAPAEIPVEIGLEVKKWISAEKLTTI